MGGTIGTYEAKTRLAALLDRVESGETLTITRNGQPVARLVPADPARPMPDAEATALVERFRELREKLRAAGVRPFTTEEIVDLVRAGRKYQPFAGTRLGFGRVRAARLGPAGRGPLGAGARGAGLPRRGRGAGAPALAGRGRQRPPDGAPARAPGPGRLPEILARLSTLPVAVDGTGADDAWTDPLARALATGLTLYDALYLEVAQRRRLPIASFDAALRRAALTTGTPVLP